MLKYDCLTVKPDCLIFKLNNDYLHRSEYQTTKSAYSVLGTNLFHYTSFPLGERCVPAQLVLDVFHFDLDSAFGLLAVGRRRHILDGRRRKVIVHEPMVVRRFVTHISTRRSSESPLDAPLMVHGTVDAGTASHHGRRARRGRTLLLPASAAVVVVYVRRVQQRHVRRVTHAESVVAAATARRTVHRCPPHALDRLRPVIRAAALHDDGGASLANRGQVSRPTCVCDPTSCLSRRRSLLERHG